MNLCVFILIFVLDLWSLCRAIVCIPSERDTLLKFKHSLSDPSHRLSSWNSTSNPNCCLWHGVVCSHVTSHVVQLHLNTSPPNWDDYTFDDYYLDEEAYEKAYEAYNRTVIGGEINPCLVDLKHLHYLDLSGNYFEGVPIPSFLGRMTSLTHLNLSYSFWGNIPSQIGNLSNLLQLDLSYSVHGTIPSQIGNLSNLLYLDLRGYYEDSLDAENLVWLSSLSKLQYLDLSRNDLLGGGMPIPSFIGTMSSLSHLDLSDAGFVGKIPYQIGNLSNLLYLDLSVNSEDSLVAENLDWLSSLSKLQYLDLSHNELLGGGMPIPSFIGKMSSLSHLDLSDAGFVGKIPYQIGNLSNLLYLDLSVNSEDSLVAENLDWLSSLSKLQYLDLSHNELLGGGMPIPSFIGKMSSLSHLDLSYARFMGDIPYQIGNLSNLVYLDLTSAANGTIPSQIGNLFNLVYLGLGSYYVNEPLFAENADWLSNLSKLEYLQLDANLSKSNDWLQTLQALPSLKHLDLSDCVLPDHYNEPSLLNFSSLLTLDLSDAISSVPKWIFGLKKLVSLQLWGNEIQGPIPDGIQNLTLLQNLELFGNSFSSSIPHWLYSLHHLKFLYLGSNKLRGDISDALGNLTSLVKLDLSNNQLEGNLTNGFGKLSSLSYLYLSQNQFSGNPFESIRSLSNLSYLDIQDNHFQGVVKEDDFANLTSLRVFYASGNKFTLKVGPNWVPTFQLSELYMSSWQLGPNFPSWIRSQNVLQYLEMSNTGILDSIPTWFWEASSQTSYLNLSHNHIHGELATSLKHPISIDTVDLSTNNLCGKLPYVSNEVSKLDISGNSLSESMDDFLCKQQGTPMHLEFLNLASNNLSGEIPDCWMIWPFLVDVNLQSNNFVGNLPPSMSSLAKLQFLHIRNNSFSGIFPTIFMKTNELISLDLGENNFSGTIPAWIGERLFYVKILRLRSNGFLGHIPNQLCYMSDLQVLDLAQNNLSGTIPSCFNNLSAMTIMNRSTDPLIHSHVLNHTAGAPFSIVIYITIDSVLLWLKGRGDEYRNFLGLVTSIDLSNNKLLGEIPREITNLNGLNFLNLSHNQLIGHIPQGIGHMVSLESVDFSRNQLSGEIPPTISNLSFLSILDLSYNHLKGKIPTGTQLQTFDPSNFIGNKLCGPPLLINCSSDGKIDSFDHNSKGKDWHGINWFFVSMTFGFVVGFWIVIGPLLICRSWRYAYFHFLDDVWFKLQSFF